MGKSNQKIGKTQPSVRKSYSASHKGIGGYKRKKKIVKVKQQHLNNIVYFDNLKKKQQNHDSKNWCYTESFVSLTISNIRTTAFCFENIKLLK